MKSAVTVALDPCFATGPFVFHDLTTGVKQARRLGFDAVELFPGDPKSLPNASALEGLSVSAVGSGAGWVKHKLSFTSPDPAVREQARQFVRELVTAADKFHAPVIIGSMQGRWGNGLTRDEALGWLAESLTELGDHAAQYGVPLIYEPLNRYETNLIHTLADGVAFVERHGLTNVKLLADLFHMNIEEADLPAAVRAAGSHVGHVHFGDSNRRAVGGGHTPMGPIIAALRDVGYAGYLSAEVFPLPDPVAAATANMTAFRQHVGQP